MLWPRAVDIGRVVPYSILCRQNHVSIDTVPLSILKLYAKHQTCFEFVHKVRPISSTLTQIVERSLAHSSKNFNSTLTANDWHQKAQEGTNLPLNNAQHMKSCLILSKTRLESKHMQLSVSLCTVHNIGQEYLKLNAVRAFIPFVYMATYEPNNFWTNCLVQIG